MNKLIMVSKVETMALLDMRRELDMIRVWIRDITTPKQERMREISKEIERRECDNDGEV